MTVTSRTISSARKTACREKAMMKEACKQTLDDIAPRIKTVKENNNNKAAQNFISSTVSEMKSVFPWNNHDIINYHYKS